MDRGNTPVYIPEWVDRDLRDEKVVSQGQGRLFPALSLLLGREKPGVTASECVFKA
jgi:hypothetical protein